MPGLLPTFTGANTLRKSVWNAAKKAAGNRGTVTWESDKRKGLGQLSQMLNPTAAGMGGAVGSGAALPRLSNKSHWARQINKGIDKLSNKRNATSGTNTGRPPARRRGAVGAMFPQTPTPTGGNTGAARTLPAQPKRPGVFGPPKRRGPSPQPAMGSRRRRTLKKRRSLSDMIYGMKR